MANPSSCRDRFVYEFDAMPFGFHLYHCHVMPWPCTSPRASTALHRRPRAGSSGGRRVAHVMNGFNTISMARATRCYAVNTVGFAYEQAPDQGQTRRAGADLPGQLAPSSTDQLFHIHGNFFHYYPTGTSLHPLSTPTPSPRSGQRGSSNCASLIRASSSSTPTRPSSPSWAGWASRGGGMTEANPGPKPAPVPPGGWPVSVVAARPGPARLIATGRSPSPSSTPRGTQADGASGRGALCRTHRAAAGPDRVTVRNDGPDAVRVAQISVNDAYVRSARMRRRSRSGAWVPRSSPSL